MDESSFRASLLYLLASINGGSMDPATILKSAAQAGFKGIPEDAWRASVAFLLCQIQSV